MKPDPRFLKQPKHFWANIRTISQQVGYTVRTKKNKGLIKVPGLEEILAGFEKLDLSTDHLVTKNGKPKKLCKDILEYYKYRAEILNNFVEPRLMDAEKARTEFNALKKKLNPKCPLPMNKQKGSKRSHAYFTCIINMLIEANAKTHACDYDPRKLTTITKDGKPLRTLARRVDGSFPSTINPIAIWEIKEYYYTTTFGSRVADGVYETLLDGMELEELAEHEGIHVMHILMIDAHFTWWECGKSYLCRIVDMLHMGYVDEVLFGYEVVEQLPAIVREWTNEYKNQKHTLSQ